MNGFCRRFMPLVFLFALASRGFVFPQWGASTETIVFVGASGTKYHRENCSTLRQTKKPLTLKDAVQSGYTACAVCKPPQLSRADAAAIAKSTALYRVNAANLKSYTKADLSRMIAAKVTRHVDGDTVELQIENPPPPLKNVEKIRMIGVDTPETVHPNMDVEFFGKEASDFTKNALLGKPVFLAFDWETRDKYGRLLAYIYLADGSCHNAELIRQGYAHAYTRFPFQFIEEFRNLEQQARAAKRGLWAGAD
jgi:micrococcal nuclease